MSGRVVGMTIIPLQKLLDDTGWVFYDGQLVNGWTGKVRIRKQGAHVACAVSDLVAAEATDLVFLSLPAHLIPMSPTTGTFPVAGGEIQLISAGRMRAKSKVNLASGAYQYLYWLT